MVYFNGTILRAKLLSYWRKLVRVLYVVNMYNLLVRYLLHKTVV